ncbi:MAG: phosphomannomutase [Acidiphilium sp. 34-60-192]|nr:MAG: phosphomannomutase [Acidiphilium sp. 34-60-192]
MTFVHQFPASVLREYDIRGIVGETLHRADAFAIGRCFGSLIARGGGHRVAVGRDGRLSSPDLSAALIEGLMASGMQVLDIGCGPTPMLYFAATTENMDGAVMVTGSHNPANYNGFKMMRGKVVAHTTGSCVRRDVSEAYVARVAQDWQGGAARLKIVWDPGNGSAGDVLADLVKRLPGEHLIINGTIDGRFPAHHPDPTVPRNLEQLIATVRKREADIGIAFDGDADRIGLVDDTGEILFGDQFLILLARDVLARHPGATIIADVKASQTLFDEVKAAGGVPLMWKTGHSLIKAKMAETGAPLAGEMSGHIFFADHWYGFDDALYAAVRVLNALIASGASLSAFRRGLPKVLNTPELRFDCVEDRKFAVVEEVASRLRADGAVVTETDGVRVNTEDGWWLLRASNTQAVLVARAEAHSPEGLQRLKSVLATQLAASGLAPDFSGSNAGH